jgi:hypothetical protein
VADILKTIMEKKAKKNSPAGSLDLGCLLGRSQAFGFVASKWNAAQAQCLLDIREQRHFQALGLTWEEFCGRYAGVSRSYADQIIRNLKEFGEVYFRLSEILHISETAYRQIAGAVDGDAIEIEGERIPIVPENAARIRKHIARLRADLDQARAARPPDSIISLRTRLDECLQEMARFARVSRDPGGQAALRGLIEYSIRILRQIPSRAA